MRRAWTFRAAIAVAVAMVALVAVASALGVVHEPAEDYVDRWLRSVSGQEAPDRGWSQLDSYSRGQSANDEGAYLRAAEGEDWSGFRWDVASSHQSEGRFWFVAVNVEGGLQSVPGFLRNSRLVRPLCVDGDAVGIQLTLERDGWPFSEVTRGPGGFTGSGERALRTGRCSVAAGPAPSLVPSGISEWTGHAFTVRNHTTTPLSMLQEDGTRVEIGPCHAVDLDKMTSTIEFRAANGYVATMGGITAYAGRDRSTTFIVVSRDEQYSDATPPRGPLPPCDEPARVQPNE